MVERGGIGDLGGLWRKGHGLSVGDEVRGLSWRVRRAAPGLQMQPDETAVASCGLAKTAALTVLRHALPRERRALVAHAAQPLRHQRVHAAAAEIEGEQRHDAVHGRAAAGAAAVEDRRAAVRVAGRVEVLRGVAQLEALHREGGRGHTTVRAGAHDTEGTPVRGGGGTTQKEARSGTSSQKRSRPAR